MGNVSLSIWKSFLFVAVRLFNPKSTVSIRASLRKGRFLSRMVMCHRTELVSGRNNSVLILVMFLDMVFSGSFLFSSPFSHYILA